MYRIYRTNREIVIEKDGIAKQIGNPEWNEFINDNGLFEKAEKLFNGSNQLVEIDEFFKARLIAPIGRQEIWASGVTYLRSRTARMEESQVAGGSDFYSKVYEAERPELFFKSTGDKCVGPGDSLHIRKDSSWDVPEPELTLFISSSGNILGYTVGNDMSSRSIEGENPLYLPQAKIYNRSASIGPCILVTDTALDPMTSITMDIERNHESLYREVISIDQMKRKFDELVEYLFRENAFPHGCFLMTGTGMVPPESFTLKAGDIIRISIDGIGTLENFIG